MTKVKRNPVTPKWARYCDGEEASEGKPTYLVMFLPAQSWGRGDSIGKAAKHAGVKSMLDLDECAIYATVDPTVRVNGMGNVIWDDQNSLIDRLQ